MMFNIIQQRRPSSTDIERSFIKLYVPQRRFGYWPGLLLIIELRGGILFMEPSTKKYQEA
jgi:hypothetical protein